MSTSPSFIGALGDFAFRGHTFSSVDLAFVCVFHAEMSMLPITSHLYVTTPTFVVVDDEHLHWAQHQSKMQARFIGFSQFLSLLNRQTRAIILLFIGMKLRDINAICIPELCVRNGGEDLRQQMCAIGYSVTERCSTSSLCLLTMTTGATQQLNNSISIVDFLNFQPLSLVSRLHASVTKSLARETALVPFSSGANDDPPARRERSRLSPILR